MIDFIKEILDRPFFRSHSKDILLVISVAVVCVSLTLLFNQNQIAAKSATIESKDSIIQTLQIEIDRLKEIKPEICANTSIIQDCHTSEAIVNELTLELNKHKSKLLLCESSKALLTGEHIQSQEYDFLDTELSINRGDMFQGDNGRFTLAVITTEHDPNRGNFQVKFRLNGEVHEKNMGDRLDFKYVDGETYTLNVRSTNSPAKFFLYKKN